MLHSVIYVDSSKCFVLGNGAIFSHLKFQRMSLRRRHCKVLLQPEDMSGGQQLHGNKNDRSVTTVDELSTQLLTDR